jgi:hypothetical protein
MHRTQQAQNNITSQSRAETEASDIRSPSKTTHQPRVSINLRASEINVEEGLGGWGAAIHREGYEMASESHGKSLEHRERHERVQKWAIVEFQLRGPSRSGSRADRRESSVDLVLNTTIVSS